MLGVKTVFVIGAGASHEVGLPVGEGLKKTIATKLDLRFQGFSKLVGQGDPAIYEVLRQRHGQEINEFLAACWRIRDGVVLSSSIDDFIDTHKDDGRLAICAKIAISRSILEAERASKLFFERENVSDTIDFSAIGTTWYPSFYRLISGGVPKANLKHLFDNVTVIAFNYDRCVEHFLAHAIAAHYQIPMTEGRELASNLPIFHPYGSVGDYFGQVPNAIEFGFSRVLDYDRIVSSLKTYTEEIADSDSLRTIRRAVSEAEVMVFLGNAFHSNNMRLLMGSGLRPKNTKVFFTRKGISDADVTVVNRYLSEVCGAAPPGVNPLIDYFAADECHDLFTRYRMSLAG